MAAMGNTAYSGYCCRLCAPLQNWQLPHALGLADDSARRYDSHITISALLLSGQALAQPQPRLSPASAPPRPCIHPPAYPEQNQLAASRPAVVHQRGIKDRAVAARNSRHHGVGFSAAIGEVCGAQHWLTAALLPT